MNIIVVGMTYIGSRIAKNLSNNDKFKLVLIDENKERCKGISKEIDTVVICGEGSDPKNLREAGIKNADALVVTTDSDAMNMVISLLGKKFSVPQVITKLDDLNLRTACKEMGIDHVISPSISAAITTSSLLRGYDLLDFSLITKGGAKLTEISPGEKKGQKIKNIDLPQDILIIGILRKGKTIIPKGKTKLKENDTILIMAENEKKISKIKDIFGDLKNENNPSKLIEDEIDFNFNVE